MGYTLFGKSAFMFFYLKNKIENTKNITVRKIKKKEIKEFKGVFNEVFTKGEKDDIYKGVSPLYGEFLQKRLKGKKKGCYAEPFAAFADRKLVGTVVIIHNKIDGYIYALAVLPEYRKMGAGKALLGACVKRAQEIKLENLCLATEKDSRNEKIFSKIGFKTKFVVKQLWKPLPV